jgi:hypothetical protein
MSFILPYKIFISCHKSCGVWLQVRLAIHSPIKIPFFTSTTSSVFAPFGLPEWQTLFASVITYGCSFKCAISRISHSQIVWRLLNILHDSVLSEHFITDTCPGNTTWLPPIRHWHLTATFFFLPPNPQWDGMTATAVKMATDQNLAFVLSSQVLP